MKCNVFHLVKQTNVNQFLSVAAHDDRRCLTVLLVMIDAVSLMMLV